VADPGAGPLCKNLQCLRESAISGKPGADGGRRPHAARRGLSSLRHAERDAGVTPHLAVTLANREVRRHERVRTPPRAISAEHSGWIGTSSRVIGRAISRNGHQENAGDGRPDIQYPSRTSDRPKRTRAGIRDDVGRMARCCSARRMASASRSFAIFNAMSSCTYIWASPSSNRRCAANRSHRRGIPRRARAVLSASGRAHRGLSPSLCRTMDLP